MKSGEINSVEEEKSREVKVESKHITKCIDGQIIARLEVSVVKEGESEGERKSKKIILNLGEKKEVFDAVVSFLDYYSKYQTGVFLVSQKNISCPEKCICNLDGSMECPEECPKGTKLCPDGLCKEKCDSDIENCKFGCL